MKKSEIKIERITSISKFNPRKTIDSSEIEGLANSIENTILLHPITVILKENKEYELVSGQRRKLAFEKLERKVIPANILKNPTDDEISGSIIL